MGYNEKHDALFDDHTKKWLEKACDDPECEFCKDRPPTAQQWPITVEALNLQRVLAYLEAEHHNDHLDDDEELNAAFSQLCDTLSQYAEANPKFDEE